MHKVVITKDEARLIHKTAEMVKADPDSDGEAVIIKPIKSFSQGLAWAERYYHDLPIILKGADKP